MHRAAFHFIKALGVPSQVTRTGKHKEVGNSSNIGDEEADDTDIDTSMDLEASVNDTEAMAETLIVDFKPGDTYLPLSIRCECQARMFASTWPTPAACITSKWYYVCGFAHAGEALVTVCLQQLRSKRYVVFFFLCPLLSTNIVLQAIDYFCVTADSNEDLPPLKGKLWSDYQLQGGEWKLIKLVHNCLKIGFLLVLFPSS